MSVSIRSRHTYSGIAVRAGIRVAIIASWLAAAGTASGQWSSPRIVGGVPTTEMPAVGALLSGSDPDTAFMRCTATLVGCQTVLTAAHCVCDTVGGDCQGAGVPLATGLFVYFEHAGFFPVAEIEVEPSFFFPTADVAVLRLAMPVTGIVPAVVNDVSRVPFGTEATIVGFGVESAVLRDAGLKRSATVTTASCVGSVASDETSICWRYTGAGGNTCGGDSGGPLFVDSGTDFVLAGVTSGGTTVDCLPADHSFDTDVFVYQSWIEMAAAGDLGTSACGGVPAVGNAGVVSTSFTDTLDVAHPFSLQSIDVAPGTSELRVALHGEEKFGVNFDLYVRGGSAPASQTFDCSATGPYQFGFCRIVEPAPGPWFLRAERVAGEGLFQLVATTFAVDPALCGNGSRDPGEVCDGADTGTCAIGCQSACECLVCSSDDLDIRRVDLAPSLMVKGRLGDDLGTYTALDPVDTGATISFTDGTNTVTIDVPPRDPGWTLVNPKRGRYRWRGARGAAVKQLQFRVRPKQPTEWNVTLKGGKIPGAAALDDDKLTARIRLGDRCAEHGVSAGPRD